MDYIIDDRESVLERYSVGKGAVSHRIPLSEVDETIVQHIINLLKNRTHVVSVVGMYCILYTNKGENVDSFSKCVSNEPDGLWDFCDYFALSMGVKDIRIRFGKDCNDGDKSMIKLLSIMMRDSHAVDSLDKVLCMGIDKDIFELREVSKSFIN